MYKVCSWILKWLASSISIKWVSDVKNGISFCDKWIGISLSILPWKIYLSHFTWGKYWWFSNLNFNFLRYQDETPLFTGFLFGLHKMQVFLICSVMVLNLLEIEVDERNNSFSLSN